MRTGRPPRGAWGRFWAASPAHRVYLLVGSIFFVASFFSDLHALSADASAQDRLEVAALVLATMAFLLQWWSTTAAFAVLLVALVPTFLGASPVMPLLVLPILLAAVLATAHSAAFRWSALAVCAVWVVAQPLSAEGDPEAIWFLAVIVGVGAGVGLFIRSAVRRREQDRRAIADAERRAAEAAERERRILARDLHDIVAHNLTIISMQARTAQYVGTPEAAQSVLQVVGDSAKDALVDLRRMLAILQQDGVVEPVPSPGTGEVEEAATVAHLSTGAERMAAELRLVGMDVQGRVDVGPDELNLGVRAALYRVMQEAVTNVAKHAGAGERCEIWAYSTEEDVVLEVRNTIPVGGPRQTENSSGVGLRSMRDRVEAFGGRLAVGPGEDGWWEVRAVVPRPVSSKAAARPAPDPSAGREAAGGTADPSPAM